MVRKYAMEKRLNTEISSTEYVRRWILFLQELKKRVTILGERDIRNFFLEGDQRIKRDRI